MSRPRLCAASLAILLGLAGCARTPTVSYNLVIPPPMQHELGAAIGGRAVAVAVTGSPFADVSPAQLASIVVAQMPSLCGARYFPVAAPQAQGITWSFTSGAPEIEADLQLHAPPRGRLSEVQGKVGAVRDAQDSAFAALVHQMTISLLRPCV